MKTIQETISEIKERADKVIESIDPSGLNTVIQDNYAIFSLRMEHVEKSWGEIVFVATSVAEACSFPLQKTDQRAINKNKNRQDDTNSSL